MQEKYKYASVDNLMKKDSEFKQIVYIGGKEYTITDERIYAFYLLAREKQPTYVNDGDKIIGLKVHSTSFGCSDQNNLLAF